MQRAVCAAAVLLWIGAIGVMAAEGQPTPDLRNAVFKLTSTNASPGGRGLQIALRCEGGKITTGVAEGYNGTSHAVDASDLMLEGNALKGRVKVTFAFDGYMPPNGKTLACIYKLDGRIEDGKLSGAMDAQPSEADLLPRACSLTGSVEALPDFSGYWVMSLKMHNAAETGTWVKASWGHRVYPKLIFKDKQLVHAFIHGHGGRAQVNYFESTVTTNDLTFDGRTLKGSITVQPTRRSEDGSPAPIYAFSFDGKVAGRHLQGDFKKRCGGVEFPGGPFGGDLEPMSEPPRGEALYYIELQDAVSGGKQLMVSVPCSGGKFGLGTAYSATWNHTYHDVDAAGLLVDGNVLKGSLNVTMNPDPYVPADHKPVPASYTIEGVITDGRIMTGKYTGTFKDADVSGSWIGEILGVRTIPEPVGVHVKLDDGVCHGAPWHRRAYIGFTATQGRADKGGMSNNKNGWKGSFKSAEVKFEGTRFTASIHGTVDESSGVKTGNYTFKLQGNVVGQDLVGRVDTYLEGQLMKTNTAFMGGFSEPK